MPSRIAIAMNFIRVSSADNAHGVFNGKIFVREGRKKPMRSRRIRCCSSRMDVDAKRQLEIFADDVKCTHGATIGQLDAEQLFYLQSRGIGLAQAAGLC